MDPHCVFCPNAACSDKGQRGQGNVQIHSQKERGYRCKTWRGTFAATRGTAFYRVHHPSGGANGGGGDAAVPRLPAAGDRT